MNIKLVCFQNALIQGVSQSNLDQKTFFFRIPNHVGLFVTVLVIISIHPR